MRASLGVGMLVGFLMLSLSVGVLRAETYSSQYQQLKLNMQRTKAESAARHRAFQMALSRTKAVSEMRHQAFRQKLQGAKMAAEANYSMNRVPSNWQNAGVMMAQPSYPEQTYRIYSKSYYAPPPQTIVVSQAPSYQVTRVSSSSPASVNGVPWRYAEEGGGRITREWHGFAIPSWVVRFKVVEDPKRKLRGYARLNQYVLLTDPDRKGGERVTQHPRSPRPPRAPKPKPSGPRKVSPNKASGKLLPAPSIKK